VSAHGGPAVLLDHPHLDRKAELALTALGAPRPDCLLVFDAITGRASHHRIRWRRRAYPIAARAAARRDCRRPGPRPPLDQPLLERYANFVRHRASLWLDRLSPAGTHFEVLVIPPLAVRPGLLEGPWSSRQRPGYSLSYRGVELQVHIPFDWCLSVERPFGSRMLETGFILEARADRRGQMLQRLDCEVTRVSSYVCRRAWARRIDAIDCGEPVPSRRWQRARRQCSVVLPDIRPTVSTGVWRRLPTLRPLTSRWELVHKVPTIVGGGTSSRHRHICHSLEPKLAGRAEAK
jgi:hypothetical protein